MGNSVVFSRSFLHPLRPFPFAISDLDEQLGIQGSETSQTYIV